MPRSTLVQSIIVVSCPLGTLKSGRNGMAADSGKPSVKVIKITASIRLYVWITVWWSCWFLIRRQLNRSRRWWCPLGRWKIPRRTRGLAHYLEHMSLMGSKKYPQADSLAEYLKMHGGSHNASTAPYRTAFYLEVENDALPGCGRPPGRCYC